MSLPSITAERLKHSRNCESRSLPFLTGYLTHHCLGHARRQNSSFPEQPSGLNCLGCFPPSLSSGQNYSFLRAQLQSCFFGYDPRLLPRAILWTLLYVSQESWAPSHLFCSLYNFQLFFFYLSIISWTWTWSCPSISLGMCQRTQMTGTCRRNHWILLGAVLWPCLLVLCDVCVWVLLFFVLEASGLKVRSLCDTVLWVV